MGILFCLGGPKSPQSAWSTVIDSLVDHYPSGRLGLLALDSGEEGANMGEADPALYSDRLSLESALASRSTMEAVTAVDSLRNSPRYEELRFVALKLLNRKDLSGTFRFIDREVALHGSLLALADILLRRRPKLIVFAVTPHEFLPYLLMQMAEHLGSRVLFFQPCPITPAMIARTTLREVVEAPGSTVGESPVSDQLRATARQQLGLLLRQKDPRYIELQRTRDLAVRRPLRRVAAFLPILSWLFRERFPEAVHFSGHARAAGFMQRLASTVITRSLQQTLQRRANAVGTDSPAVENRFVVFALHYEPERTSLPEGLPVAFQGEALVALRAQIPADVTLVVKEHYSQQSTALRGFAGRSPDFYKFVESMPNTQFAPLSELLSDLVQRSEAVFTLTGTIAIEAVLKGTPVGYFGSPWWGGLPGTHLIEGDIDLEAIKSLPMPSVDEVFDFFDRLIASTMIPGIASERPSVVERKLGPLPDGFFEAEAAAIVEVIRQVSRE